MDANVDIEVNVKTVLAKQKQFFAGGMTRSLNFRMEQIKCLKDSIIRHEEAIFAALKADLNKAPFETYATEIGIVIDELNYALHHLPGWAKDKKVRTPITQFFSSSRIVSEPYGVSLIISPWNYPFQLALAPLVGAIAGGNCAIIKPSEYALQTSALLSALIKENFPEEYLTVVEGGPEISQLLLEEEFDRIFFTGSVGVGKMVMAAAARHLTPVTLELGGKSPCIVARDANLDLAARRIVWGKYLNAGQTCVAPDYLVVHKSIKKDLFLSLRKYITEFYGSDPCANDDFPRIINERHFQRLAGFLKEGEIVIGGKTRRENLCIAPTVIDGIDWDSPIMQDEIFGPLLPVMEYEEMDRVIEEINKRPKPLALYLFTTCEITEKKIMDQVSFGGGCINDTIVHLASPHLPFGGTGESGIGAYHGKYSFDTFTHKKSILKKSNLFDLKLRYPPYENKLKWLKVFFR